VRGVSTANPSNRVIIYMLVAAACSGQRAPDRPDQPTSAVPTTGEVAAPPAQEAAMTSPAAPGSTAPGSTPPGSTAPGSTAPGSTPPGDSAAAMAASAGALLAAVGTGDARGRLALPFDSDAREDWSYVPRSRAGLSLGEMTEPQRRALWALMDTGLSKSGRAKVEGILTIEPILGEIEGNRNRDPGRYHVALFGNPAGQPAAASAAGGAPWGWRFEGHHLSLHFTVAGEVATTPAFLGANPARVPRGAHQGLRVLGREEDQGRAFLLSLTAEQRRRATISSEAPADIITKTSRRVALRQLEGLPAADMTQEQRAALVQLIEVYALNFQPALARAHLERIRGAGVERLHFAWAGSDRPGQSHYYRIQGPTHLIEYDNRGGDHVHTVFRDLARDFGESHLARHLRKDHGG
jgi:hypothetical protein